MGRKMSKYSENWKEQRRKWPISKTIGDFRLDAWVITSFPVSLKLRSNMKTPKAKEIIRRTERLLLNERIRMINNTLEMLKHVKDTCIEDLSKALKQEDMEECKDYMNNIKEERHFNTMA